MRLLAFLVLGVGCACAAQQVGEGVGGGAADPAPPVVADGDANAPENARDWSGKLPIGMNISRITPDNHEWVFVDAMRRADEWKYLADSRGGGRQREGSGTPVPVDDQGWPLPAAGKTVVTRIYTRMDGHYPAGKYVCTWEGSGELGFRRAAKVVEQGDHRLVVEVVPRRGEIALSISRSDPADPVRNIRLWLPGFEGAESPFHPLWLEGLRPFQALRFSNWGCVYYNDGRWDGRPTPDAARQSTRNGVAVELMIDLCNALDAEPWFTMPHTADDEFVRSFAELVKARLEPGRRIWLEWSNETWNKIFPQGKWCAGEATRRGVSVHAVHAEEAKRDYAIWHEVFGDERERVVRVASGHRANPRVARAVVRGLGDAVDCIALGAYFGIRGESEGLSMQSSPEDVVRSARQHLEQRTLPLIREHAQLARDHAAAIGHPVLLVAYEGGPHIGAKKGSIGDGGRELAIPLESAFGAQTLPALGEAYRTLLDGSREAGMDLFFAFLYVRRNEAAGCFGHLVHQDDPLDRSVKYQALLQGWLD